MEKRLKTKKQLCDRIDELKRYNEIIKGKENDMTEEERAEALFRRFQIWPPWTGLRTRERVPPGKGAPATRWSSSLM